MVVGAKVCELTYGFLWFVCGLYVGILTSSLRIQPREGGKVNHWKKYAKTMYWDSEL